MQTEFFYCKKNLHFYGRLEIFQIFICVSIITVFTVPQNSSAISDDTTVGYMTKKYLVEKLTKKRIDCFFFKESKKFQTV